jgi:MYXO-CTERM domain-containing protein
VTHSSICRRALLALPLALSSAACTSLSPEEVASDRAPIVNGSLDTQDPAVVALTFQGQAFCTGTLVSPDVVLTAAHCVDSASTGISVAEIGIFFGNDDSGSGTTIQAFEGGPHPAYVPEPQTYVLYDVGVLRLSRPASVTPLPMATQPFDGSFIGDSVRLVGFGVTEFNGNDSGTKRQATAHIADFGGSVFFMELSPSGTCNGDSGGPAFLVENGNEVVAGIHSRSDCETVMVDERVHLHVAGFIQPFIDSGPKPTCAPDGLCATGCSSPDPDCPCAEDGFCTAACQDTASDPDCDPKCGAEGTCVEGCPLPDPDCATTCGADGVCDAACDADPDCALACVADDVCEDGCGDSDPDCDGESGSGGGEEGGCSVSPSRPSTLPWLGAAAALGLALARRRRRPNGSG